MFNWQQIVTWKRKLHTYFLDVIARMRVLPRNNRTVGDFVWIILKSIPQQYSIAIACDSYKDNSIKHLDRIGQGFGLKYLLKYPDMTISSEFLIFVESGKNKTTLLNLTELVYKKNNRKLQDRVIYFWNKNSPVAKKSVQMVLSIAILLFWTWQS